MAAAAASENAATSHKEGGCDSEMPPSQLRLLAASASRRNCHPAASRRRGSRATARPAGQR